jgi:hypothetical protein
MSIIRVLTQEGNKKTALEEWYRKEWERYWDRLG